MSIRLKLTIMFLAIASIPLLFVSILTFSNYKKSLEANRLAQLRDLTVFRADRIESYFAGLKAHIEISQGFYNVKKNLPVLTRLADDPNNPELLAAKKMLDEQLQQMQSVSDLSDIMLISPEGKVVYTNKPGHYFKDMSNGVDAEQKAFSQGKNRVYYSDVYFDKEEDNRFETLLTAPASDFNGAFIGVIAFEVDMTPAYKLIQDTTGLGTTGEVLVGKKTGNQVEYLNPLRHDPNAALKRRIDIGGEIGRPMQEAVQGKTGVGQYFDYRGKKVIAAWRYIPSLGWGMVAKIDTEEAFADVTNLRNLAMIILVIVIVLSGITAFSIAQSISEPIKKLSKGAEIIGSGNLDYKIGTALKDEIGQLSRSFDKMTYDLKQTTASRDELNREITERKRAEKEKDILLYNVRERVKELNCLYGISAIVETPDISLDEILLKIVNVIPAAWQYPDITCARIAIDKQEYKTANYKETKWKQAADIMVDGRKVGCTEVFYLEEKVEIDEGPFFKEERALITAISERLGHITERKLAEEALRQTRDNLIRSNKDLEQFAYVASHDLQEPLRAVAGFVELIKRSLQDSLDDKTKEYINFSVDGAKRMQTLISGLLEYSRVGTQGKKPKKTSTKDALDEAIARLATSIKETGAEITADDLPIVHFDDVQLSQLFQNLIGNAIKFRSEQAPRIRINAVRQDSGWQFAVADNGIGIEPQYTEKIFQIFQRLHGRDKYPGTGIGLSICKKIVERHNGKIWVESKPGNGSTFYFTVPDLGEA